MQRLCGLQQGPEQLAIAEQRNIATWQKDTLQSIQSADHPVKVTEAVERFHMAMDDFSSSRVVNAGHCNAIMHSTAEVWVASDAALASSQSEQLQNLQNAQSCTTQLLQTFNERQIVPQLDASQANNMLSSLVRLRMATSKDVVYAMSGLGLEAC